MRPQTASKKQKCFLEAWGIELLLKTVDKEPSDLSYEFGRWTTERLATYLTENTLDKIPKRSNETALLREGG